MTLRVVFRRAAKIEFEEAAVWYGEKGPGLGDESPPQFEKATQNAQCRFRDRKQQASCCKKMSA